MEELSSPSHVVKLYPYESNKTIYTDTFIAKRRK